MQFRRYKGGVELSRFSTEKGLQILGGFSRLLSYSIPKLKGMGFKKIISFAECDTTPVAENSVYTKSGFEYKGLLPPRLWYYVTKPFLQFEVGSYNRRNFQKKMLPKYWDDCDMSLREIDICAMHGVYPVYGCGFHSFEMLI
jgi:hypothetical protein